MLHVPVPLADLLSMATNESAESQSNINPEFDVLVLEKDAREMPSFCARWYPQSSMFAIMKLEPNTDENKIDEFAKQLYDKFSPDVYGDDGVEGFIQQQGAGYGFF